MWTAAETNSAIICSCLPEIRALCRTGRKVVSEAASRRKSLTVLFTRGGKSKASKPKTIDEYPFHGDMVYKDVGSAITIPDLDNPDSITETPIQ